ncbi:MAG: FMN-binding negative transcriptional regulator [Candidatus Thiodiazotropha sp.]
MHIPQHFSQVDPKALQGLIRRHPFAVLITQGLNAVHLPLELLDADTGFGKLAGHVARANPLWHECSTGQEALAIFQGGHAYVSPSWYASKHRTGRVVPTWNYRVVHARGNIRLIDDETWLHTHLQRMTDQMEAQSLQPWSLADAPRDFINGLVKGVVGIELEIRSLTGKWKLSQNRSQEDRNGVVEGLRGLGSAEGETLIEAMLNKSS